MTFETYSAFATALKGVGLTAQPHTNNSYVMIVSAQEGPVLPTGSNSFKLSLIDETWCLSTWAPFYYRVPAEVDVLKLCLACMKANKTAMAMVPPKIVARFKLKKLSDDETTEYEKCLDDVNRAFRNRRQFQGSTHQTRDKAGGERST